MNHRGRHRRQGSGIFHNGYGQVFHFCVVMSGVRKHTGHPVRKAHHPAEHINMMHRMIQGTTAAFLFPGSPPPEVVVGMAAEPEGIDLRGPDAAGHAAVQQRLQVPDRLPETVLRDNRKPLSALVPRFQHFIAFFEGSGHGFFTYYILAAPKRIDADFSM